jgi:predicted RND superfamily exporter protein
MSNRSDAEQPSFYARRGVLIMTVAVCLLPIAAWGVLKAAQSNNNNIKQWLPSGLPETDVYRDFRSQFGSDEYAVVSWDGCTLDDPRLEQFADAALLATTAIETKKEKSPGMKLIAWIDFLLATPEEKKEHASGEKLFLSVTTGARLRNTLLDPPVDLKYRQADARLKGILISRKSVGKMSDGQKNYITCAIVKLAPAGDEDRTAAVQALYEAAEKVGLSRDQIYLAGETVSNAFLDSESQDSINQLSGLSVVVALLVALLSLRSLRLTVVVFVVAGYASVASQALVHLTGGQMNLVMVVMPVLVYVLSISAGIHVINYYRDAIRKNGLPGAMSRAVSHGWVPCVLASATTAAGLISLNVSHVQPVKDFGLYGALGLIASLAFVFLLLPALLERWPLRTESTTDSPGGTVTSQLTRTDRFVRACGAATIRFRYPALVVCGVMLVGVGWGVQAINTSVKPMKFFTEESKIVRDSTWLENNIGPLVPIEIVLRFDRSENQLTMLQRFREVAAVQKQIQSLETVGGTMSTTIYAPPLGDRKKGFGGTIIQNKIRTKAFNRMLESNRKFFIEQRYLSEEKDDQGRITAQLYRITARVPMLEDINYAIFLKEIEKKVNGYFEVLAEKDATAIGKGKKAKYRGITASYTGAVPLVFAAQNELLKGLFESFILAFFLIGLVMIVLMIHGRTPMDVLRGIGAGVFVMLPNVFPALVIFGAMGWLGRVVDVGSMLTASVAMGIAVDDTLHFLTWFRRSITAGASRNAAILQAYRRCAVAMTQTTAIAGLGLLVFSYSGFKPVSQFGLMMSLLLVMALVGDLILLPALLASPVGKLFERRRTRRQPDPDSKLVA